MNKSNPKTSARAATRTPAASTRGVDAAGEQQHFFFVMAVFAQGRGIVPCRESSKIRIRRATHRKFTGDAPDAFRWCSVVVASMVSCGEGGNVVVSANG